LTECVAVVYLHLDILAACAPPKVIPSLGTTSADPDRPCLRPRSVIWKVASFISKLKKLITRPMCFQITITVTGFINSLEL
jgi:hypothetical protein